MPTSIGRLTGPADGDAANAESVNVAYRQLRQAVGDQAFRNQSITRLSGTLNEARAAIGAAFGTWIVGGASGDIAVSQNGLEWTELADSTTETILGLAIYGATTIAVGAAGMFARATTSALVAGSPSWSYTTPDASFSGSFRSVVLGTTHIVAVGNNGEIQRAAVGVLGTLTHIANDGSYAGNFECVIYDEGAERFIAFGDDGEIQYSDDEGATWTSIGAVGTNWLSAATDGEGNVFAVGTDSIRFSRDAGETWTAFTLGFGGTRNAIVYTGVNFAVLNQGSEVCSVYWFNPEDEGINNDNFTYVSGNMRGFAFGVQPRIIGMPMAWGILAVGSEAGSDFVIARFLGGRI